MNDLTNWTIQKQWKPLLQFNCDAGGCALSEHILRETLNGAQRVREITDAKAEGWEWRTSLTQYLHFLELPVAAKQFIEMPSSEPTAAVIRLGNSRPELVQRTMVGLPVRINPAARNNIYLVDKAGQVAGWISNLEVPREVA